MTIWNSENLLIINNLTEKEKKLFSRWRAEQEKSKKQGRLGQGTEDLLLAK